MRKILLFSFLLFLSVSFVCADYLLDIVPERETVVILPDLVGSVWEENESSVSALPLSIETETRYDENTPFGRVISQYPAPGSRHKISPRREIVLHLVISLGQESKTVPNVIGMDRRAAESLVRESGFGVRLEWISGDQPGKVLSCDPLPGTHLNAGGIVVLQVSEGTESKSITVPNLVGMSRGNALFEIYMRKLTVESVVEEVSTQPVGTVIRQTPAAGSYVRPHTAITIVISKEVTQ